MMKHAILTTMTIALGVTLWTTPALSQGNGRGNQRERPSVEKVKQGSDIYSQPADRRSAGVRRGNGSGKVPPGWCKGVGNPHRTVENCGYGRGSADYDYSNRNGSYEESHARFHRELDARYSRLAAERPLDLGYRLELERRKRAEHEEWHRRVGISH